MLGLSGVLFVGPYEYRGAIRVEPERALQVAQTLLDFDRDTLYLGALDGCSGLYVDRYEDQSEWLIELAIWGEWVELIAPFVAT
jgi:hypothetical protein